MSHVKVKESLCHCVSFRGLDSYNIAYHYHIDENINIYAVGKYERIGIQYINMKSYEENEKNVK